MDVQSLLGPVQTALVPVVLASTGGLLCLLVQTRYGRIIDRTRELIHLRDESVDKSLEMLFKRARYAKWSLFGLFFGISCFLTLSLIILVSILFPATMPESAAIVIIFFVGMISMLVGVWYEVLELWTSFSGLEFEYSTYKQKIKQ